MLQATTIKKIWKLRKEKRILKYKKFLKDKWHTMLRRGANKKQYNGEEFFW